jgi:hypothetical protein
LNAQELLAAVEQAKQSVTDRIAELRAQQLTIGEELAALGAKRLRKKAEKKGPGRPRGSKNKPKPAPEA